MPKCVSKELPASLFDRLSGRDVDRYLEHVILLYTVDGNGYAHPSILSYFEVAAKDPSNLRLATYSDSKTTENMKSRGKVTLSIFDKRLAYSIKGTVREIRRGMRAVARNSISYVAVDQVLVDEADPVLEPGAYIAAGINCVNPNIGTERTWRNEVLNELLESL